MVAIPETAPTRAAMVTAYRDALVALVEDATHTVEDLSNATQEALVLTVAATAGLDVAAEVEDAIGNVPVLTRRDVDEAIAAVFSQPIPMPEDTTAEVHTPATVIVSAICPRCSISQLIVVTMKPELLVSDEGSEIRIKAKAKGRAHICGQLPLPVNAEADGQEALGLEDPDGEDVVETDPQEFAEAAAELVEA